MADNFNITNVDVPGFLMNVPFSLSADLPNNIWMEELTAAERCVDKGKALSQFIDLYRYLTRSSIVYVLPSRPGLQDLTFVSNLGVVLPHLPESTTVISRFRSKPRIGEAQVGLEFFRTMDFSVHTVPAHLSDASKECGGQQNEEGQAVYFEGEADLKYLRENVYVGGYGIRTTRSALDWFSKRFGMQIIPFRMTDERLFHLDCCVLPVSSTAVVVCTEIAQTSTLREIEKYAEIMDVSRAEAHAGVTNSLILRDEMLYASDIDTLPKSHEAYPAEVILNNRIEAICNRLRMNPRRFDLSEFYKSGGGLACMIMHLNYANRIRGAK